MAPHYLSVVRDRYLRSRGLRNLRKHGRGQGPPDDLNDLAAATEGVLQSAASLAGADLLIDSSKRAGATLLLHWFTSLDVRVVHLVRDPRATVFSRSRSKENPASGVAMPKKPALASVLTWMGLNWTIDRYVAPHVPTLRVRYEDLVTHPDATLEVIWDFVQKSPEPSGKKIVEHTVSGNPSRFVGSSIIPDMAWTDQMPPCTRMLVTALSLPLLRRYGYPVRTPVA